MKVVTIAISAYNKQDYLNRCVQSLICPSINKLEVIIVNDGSSDNTSEIAHQWATSYPASIKVVDKENGHQGSCVNVAMDMATGSYFKMLDADDFFDTDVLEQYVNKLEVMDVDMVITGHIICGKTPIAICPPCSMDDKIVQLEDFSFIELGMEQCLGMHGVTYKTSILQDNHIRLTEKCSFSDAEFCYYPMRHCQTALFIAKNLYLYQTGVSGSESSLISEKVKNDAYDVTERMLNDYIKHPDIAVGGGKNKQQIVLLRCIMAYMSQYLLHFKTNRIDNQKTLGMLRRIELDIPELYRQMDSITSRKIPFIRIFKIFHITSVHLYRLLNMIYSIGKA